MLNWYFYNTFPGDVNQDFETSKNTKIYISQNPKNTKHRVHTKQRNGGTKNKHCNLLIYTIPLNRVRIEHCYYNIQTVQYHNNADLIFLQCIFRRCQRRLLILEKTQKFTFLKIQKIQTTEYNQNNGTGEPEINTEICWFTQSHSTEYWLNVVTTIFNQYSNTIMLNWCFYNAFSEDVNEDFWYFKNTKFYICQNPKKHKIPNTIKTTERGKQK